MRKEIKEKLKATVHKGFIIEGYRNFTIFKWVNKNFYSLSYKIVSIHVLTILCFLVRRLYKFIYKKKNKNFYGKKIYRNNINQNTFH